MHFAHKKIFWQRSELVGESPLVTKSLGLERIFILWTEHTITLASWTLPSGWSAASSLQYVYNVHCTVYI